MARASARGRAWTAALVVAAALAACAREEVEVAEADAGTESPVADPQPPPFVEGGADALLAACGPPPALGRCPPCPNGYLPLADGGSSCECCP